MAGRVAAVALRGASLVLALIMAGAAAKAQTYPTRPIQMIVP